MKNLSVLTLSAAVALGVLVGMNWHRVPIQLVAQESPQTKKTDKRAETDVVPTDVSRESTFPAFFVNDVIESLKKSTEELIANKLTRNSDELRKELDRTDVSIQLPKPSTKELSSQELYLRAAESVFLVAGLTKPKAGETDWQTAFSTAFVVHKDGILSTSAHVFDHDDQDDAVVVMDVRGRVFPVVEILASDRPGDTCLFRIGTKGLKPLPLGAPALPGTPIRVIGHPGDSFFYFSAGHIANYEHDHEGILWLNVTADFGQGSSGGPVMDSAGNIIGQVSRTYTLYAGGEASQRKHRPIRVRQVADAETTEEKKTESPHDEGALKNHPDPQMVFKSCTPVTAIRALVK